MIRPFTCVAFLLACISGFYLYQEKHKAKVLDDHIAQIIKQTDELREQSRMMSAEWTLLNDPERLRKLADQYLNLQPVAPTQFTSLADLDSHLPPPLPPATSVIAGPATATTPGPVPVAAAGGAQAPDAAVAAGTAAAPPTGTVAGAAIADKAADARAVAAAGAVATATQHAQTEGGDRRIADTTAADTRSVAADAAAAAPPPRAAASRQPVPDRAADHRRTAPAPRLVASQPRLPDQRNADQRSVARAVPLQPRFVRPVDDMHPIVAARVPQQRPTQMGGSLLGMAHDMASPPAPMPLPRPMPMTGTYSYSGGN